MPSGGQADFTHSVAVGPTFSGMRALIHSVSLPGLTRQSSPSAALFWIAGSSPAMIAGKLKRRASLGAWSDSGAERGALPQRGGTGDSVISTMSKNG
jgi:hypothetical protein